MKLIIAIFFIDFEMFSIKIDKLSSEKALNYMRRK